MEKSSYFCHRYTQPKNETLADCVKQQVSQVQWKDKVKSLNTVEFQY